MPRKTTFKDTWLRNDYKDRNGDFLSDWCERVTNDSHAVRCRVCCKTFSISNMGLAQIQSHSEGKKHIIDNMKSSRNQAFFKPKMTKSDQAEETPVASTSTAVSGDKSTHTLCMVPPKLGHWLPVCQDDKVKQAEILFAIKLASSNYSFRSYADIGDICRLAFTDSEIAQHIKLSASKVSYMITHGLSPYFRAMFLDDCRAGSGFYTLYFDETTTRQVKKQMDFHIGYWSNKWNRVVVVYIDSVFLGHADADKLLEVVVKFIEDNNLDTRKLLQVSMDGPSVNLSFQRKLNTHLASQGISELINIGTCSLHPVHTAFMKGIDKIEFDVDQFSNDVFSWFKLSAARREDYSELQKEELLETAGEFFLRPVSSRWLSMEPVCRRIIEQYPAMKKYFLVTLPKAANNKSICSGDRYKRIRIALEDPGTLANLNFIAFLASCLTPFLKLFQACEPLIHVLHEKLNELVRTLMLLFLKVDVVSGKEGRSLMEVKCYDGGNWLPLKSVAVGSGTSAALVAMTKEDERKKIRQSFRSCLLATVTYLQERLPLSDPVIRDVQCLHPLMRNTEQGKNAIKRLCSHLTKVTKDDAFIDQVNGEWLLYMLEDDKKIDQWIVDHPGEGNDICGYWFSITQMTDCSGAKKYVKLGAVAKAALTLSHGNAIPERGFSANNSLLSKERLSLAENTIVAERIVKEAVRLFGNVTSIPITKKFITTIKNSYAEYAHEMEMKKEEERLKEVEQQRQTQLVEEKRTLLSRQDALKKLINEQENIEKAEVLEEETARNLISEATVKLTVSLQNNDIKGAKVAQVMLAAGNDKLQKTCKLLNVIREQKRKYSEKLDICKFGANVEDEPSKKRIKK